MRNFLTVVLLAILVGCTDGTPISKTTRNQMPSADWQLMGINEWEENGHDVSTYTLRFKVKGGYLFRVSSHSSGRVAEAMTFVPDADAK